MPPRPRTGFRDQAPLRKRPNDEHESQCQSGSSSHRRAPGQVAIQGAHPQRRGTPERIEDESGGWSRSRRRGSWLGLGAPWDPV